MKTVYNDSRSCEKTAYLLTRMLWVIPGSIESGIEAFATLKPLGAGDTVVSTLCLALAAGAEMLEAVELANAAAGVVVGKIGTASVNPTELLDWF